MLKSYYEILNVSQSASKTEIKNQFKKLAKMYHPDINSSLEAETLFKEINKAAQILLDDEKRKKYDAFRNSAQNINANPNTSQYSFHDIFRKKTQKNKDNQEKQKPRNGEDITVNIEIDYMEAILGTNRCINITHNSVCPKCNGYKFANGQKCSYCNGLGEKTVNKKITVKIPKGLKNGAKLRIKGEGQVGKFGGENGNLYIIVKIEKNEEFKIKNDIVYSQVQISPYVAILGGNVPISTLWGEAVIKIPPLTKSGQSFKLMDVGVLNEKTNKKGEQSVKIIIQIPSEISEKERILYEKLRDLNAGKKNAKSINN